MCSDPRLRVWWRRRAAMAQTDRGLEISLHAEPASDYAHAFRISSEGQLLTRK